MFAYTFKSLCDLINAARTMNGIQIILRQHFRGDVVVEAWAANEYGAPNAVRLSNPLTGDEVVMVKGPSLRTLKVALLAALETFSLEPVAAPAVEAPAAPAATAADIETGDEDDEAAPVQLKWGNLPAGPEAYHRHAARVAVSNRVWRLELAFLRSGRVFIGAVRLYDTVGATIRGAMFESLDEARRVAVDELTAKKAPKAVLAKVAELLPDFIEDAVVAYHMD